MSNHTFYHVTPIDNIQSIFQNGLLPQIGALSRIANEIKPAIYLFYTKADLEDGLSNWLGDELCNQYGDDCEFAILYINLPDNFPIIRREFDFECTTETAIPVEYISFYNEDGCPINIVDYRKPTDCC